MIAILGIPVGAIGQGLGVCAVCGYPAETPMNGVEVPGILPFAQISRSRFFDFGRCSDLRSL